MASRAERAAYNAASPYLGTYDRERKRLCSNAAVEAVLSLLASDECRAAVAGRWQVHPASGPVVGAVDAVLAWLGEEVPTPTPNRGYPPE